MRHKSLSGLKSLFAHESFADQYLLFHGKVGYAWIGNSNNGLSNGNVGDGTYMYIINLGDGSEPLSGTVVVKKR